jgi:hypothetical protein
MKFLARKWILVWVDLAMFLALGVAMAKSDLAVSADDGQGLTVIHWLDGDANLDRS